MAPDSEYTRRGFITLEWIKDKMPTSEEDAPQASPSAAIDEATLRDQITCAVQTATEIHSVVDAKMEAYTGRQKV